MTIDKKLVDQWHKDWAQTDMHVIRDDLYIAQRAYDAGRKAGMEEAAEICDNYVEWAHWGQDDNYVVANAGALDCAKEIREAAK